MVLYSLLLTVGLTVSAPVWLWRMVTTGRYREGLGERLGFVPRRLVEAVRGREVVWVHAVSVGEALAAERMVAELRERLGEGWVVVVSSTTATGQKVAREKFGAGTVFYLPLDFAWPVRRYLRALRPKVLVLMENEMWPRLLTECNRRGIPATVVNARVSDRSFAQSGWWVRMWRRMMLLVTEFLAQGPETEQRLIAMGVPAERIRVTGNLKYDLPAVVRGSIAQRLKELRGTSRVIVAGSTHPGEERLLLDAWPRVLRGAPDVILVIAPRHPHRFGDVAELIGASGSPWVRGADLLGPDAALGGGTIVLLDTIGDLASVYSVAQAAFLGGSLIPHGGQNPLEAARFAVPTIMGPHYQNFREIVEGMEEAGAGPRILRQADSGAPIPMHELLAGALIDRVRYGQDEGKRAKLFYESQAGSTKKTVDAVLELMGA